MNIAIENAALRDVSFVMANLRKMDEAEVMCQVPDGTKKHEIAYSLLNSGDCFVAKIDGAPVAVFGTHALNVAACVAWALGTRRMWRVTPAITRFFREVHGPELMRRGFSIMEARSIANHHKAHVWMLSTGAEIIGPPFIFGKGNEEFVLFRWNSVSLKSE